MARLAPGIRAGSRSAWRLLIHHAARGPDDRLEEDPQRMNRRPNGLNRTEAIDLSNTNTHDSRSASSRRSWIEEMIGCFIAGNRN